MIYHTYRIYHISSYRDVSAKCFIYFGVFTELAYPVLSACIFAFATDIPERKNVFHLQYPTNWRYPEINSLFSDFGK